MSEIFILMWHSSDDCLSSLAHLHHPGDLYHSSYTHLPHFGEDVVERQLETMDPRTELL